MRNKGKIKPPPYVPFFPGSTSLHCQLPYLPPTTLSGREGTGNRDSSCSSFPLTFPLLQSESSMGHRRSLLLEHLLGDGRAVSHTFSPHCRAAFCPFLHLFSQGTPPASLTGSTVAAVGLLRNQPRAAPHLSSGRSLQPHHQRLGTDTLYSSRNTDFEKP